MKLPTSMRDARTSLKSETDESGSSLYDIPLTLLDGTSLDLNDYRGQHILFVNVASKCGFTPQYKGLEALYKEHQGHLLIVGVPCNQFGSQEPGGHKEIQQFCELNYGVSFPITEKMMVKGSGQHPLYQWLTQKSMNGKSNSKVRWNFQKYLVSPEGTLIDYFYSTTPPTSKKITRYFS